MRSPADPRRAAPAASRSDVRPWRATDAADLAALLDWMDSDPRREVFAPLARRLDDLNWECRGKPAFVAVDANGDLVGFAALAAHAPGRRADSLVVEGPLSAGGGAGAALNAAVEHARRAGARTLYAFTGAENAAARLTLERAGFDAFQTTAFFSLPRPRRSRPPVSVPPGVTRLEPLGVDFVAYRDLYRDSDDGWAERLDWTAADYRRRFSNRDVHLVALGVNGRPVAHCEVEWDDDAAEIAYLGVSPAYRGRGLGRVALELGVQAAFSRPEVMRLVARAHDHEGDAARLYRRAGFREARRVTAFTMEFARRE